MKEKGAMFGPHFGCRVGRDGPGRAPGLGRAGGDGPGRAPGLGRAGGDGPGRAPDWARLAATPPHGLRVPELAFALRAPPR